MKGYPAVLVLTASLSAGGVLATPVADDETQIRALTEKFCKSMEQGDLSILDEMFDLSEGNIFYDINEGPLTPEGLERVWNAATTNYELRHFAFTEMNVSVDGDRALQTGSWEQTQAAKSGETRDITGRATILWKRTATGWKVYHYHASVTPPRRQRSSR